MASRNLSTCVKLPQVLSKVSSKEARFDGNIKKFRLTGFSYLALCVAPLASPELLARNTCSLLPSDLLRRDHSALQGMLIWTEVQGTSHTHSAKDNGYHRQRQGKNGNLKGKKMEEIKTHLPVHHLGQIPIPPNRLASLPKPSPLPPELALSVVTQQIHLSSDA